MHTEAVEAAFAHWGRGDSRPFMALVADDVVWTVIGTTPISGTYRDKASFLAAAGRLFDQLTGPILATVVEVIGAGDRVILRWEGRSEGRNGTPYHQHYCWVMRLAGDRIAEVVAYLDTELITAMFEASPRD
jgi:hypothetical protein